MTPPAATPGPFEGVPAHLGQPLSHWLRGRTCYARAARGGGLALVLYDLTTLCFETPREDGLRKVGMSKERRVDPQVTVGLLTDKAAGFPLQVHLFEGNKAETTTIVPVLTEFRDQHPEAKDIVVVADAGMLSAANLLALEEAGFCFIVGSKTSKAPYDLAEHLERHGNAFDDGQTIETTRRMGTGKHARDRRVVWRWSFKRYRHDIQAINAMVERAEAVADGKRALKRDRFVKVTDADPGSRIKDQGSRIKDQGSRIKDQGSVEKFAAIDEPAGVCARAMCTDRVIAGRSPAGGLMIPFRRLLAITAAAAPLPP